MVRLRSHIRPIRPFINTGSVPYEVGDIHSDKFVDEQKTGQNSEITIVNDILGRHGINVDAPETVTRARLKSAPVRRGGWRREGGRGRASETGARARPFHSLSCHRPRRSPGRGRLAIPALYFSRTIERVSVQSPTVSR